MKKLLCAAMALLLCLSAVACGTAKDNKKEPFQPVQTVQALVESGAFSGEMMEFDHTLLFQLPGDGTGYEGTVVYYNMMGISEVAAVIKVAQEADVAQVEQALKDWVDMTKTNESDYRPAEAEKLDNAILETRGNTVLLVVAADAEKAKSAIE